MDGEDVYGYKIKVQFVAGPPSAASPVLQSRATNGGDGSPTASPSTGAGASTKAKKTRRENAPDCRLTCSASTSNDSGVKLSSSDDNEGVTEDHPSAPADSMPLPQPHDRVASTLCSVASSNGDDIVVCGPVEEIDVDTEMPTKDVITYDIIPTPVTTGDVRTTPSKKTKKKKSKCASKQSAFLLCPRVYLM